MPRSAREQNDSFPDLAQLPDPDTQVFVPPTDRRELMKLQYNTMKQQIHLVADKPQDEAQALARLQAFVARRQSDEDNDSEAERVEQKTSAARAEADALTAMLNPPFRGSDWIEVDASESEVQESQPQRVPGGHKRRRATARARMTQAADQPDTGLGYLCAKFVEPALDHLRFQTQQKRSTEVIMDPVMTRAQREARLHRPESETRIGWIQNMLDNMDNFFPRDKPRTTVQRQCHYWYTQTLFPWVFGVQWDVIKTRVLRRYKLERVRPWVQVLMPRREGKTWSVASFLAAVLLFIPGILISIFSPTSQQSNMMKDEIYRMIAHYEQNTGRPATRRIVRYNNRNIKVADRPMPDGVSMRSSTADAMVLEANTSTLMLCNSNTDAEHTLKEVAGWTCLYDLAPVQGAYRYPFTVVVAPSRHSKSRVMRSYLEQRREEEKLAAIPE